MTVQVRGRAPSHRSTRPRWQFSLVNLLVALFTLAGLGALVYPHAAAWVAQHNQSNVIVDQARADAMSGYEEAQRQLAAARAYNQTLDGAARYEAGSNVAEGTADGVGGLDYESLLVNPATGMMARLKVPAIGLDLLVYHGTSDATLLRGVGHLEGTALPVGGDGTRSVLTGHRGLATATMFSNLDRIELGDVMVVEVFGDVLTYVVDDIRVIDPDETTEIRPVPGRDLLTLVTCTPLGLNTHRILVTGERTSPTPAEYLADAGRRPDVPGFPWWLVILGGGVAATGTWYWSSGRPGRGAAVTGRRDRRPQ